MPIQPARRSSGLSGRSRQFSGNGKSASGATRCLAPQVVAAIALVATDFGVDPHAIPGRGRRVAIVGLARRVAIYLCSVGLDMTPRRVAAAFQCHHSTIELGLGLVEDWRDNPAFDGRMDRLTARLVGHSSRP